MPGETGNTSPQIARIEHAIPHHPELPSRAVLERYRQKSEWFETYSNREHAKSKVHGSGHHARVLVWSAHLASQLPETIQESLNTEALYWAASIHDLGRTSNYELNELRKFPHHQKPHEERGEKWARDNWQLLDPNLSQETVEMIAVLVRNHGEHGEKMSSNPIEQQILIYADILEIKRALKGVPESIRRHAPAGLKTPPNPLAALSRAIVRNRTRSEDVTALLPTARQFVRQSHRHPVYAADPYTAVFDVAQHLQLIGD
ncbi:MAG: hypothetical protein RLZZ455_707 [Candidatus Parcubacteria bacterium]|jgi:hypothetical protein